MNPLTDQLERVRQTSRRLLLAQRLSQAAAGLLVIALGLALIDYLLDLPAIVRLGVGLTALGLFGLWLVRRLTPAWRFRPALADLALRAERLYPQLAGHFASAVEFSAASADAPSVHESENDPSKYHASNWPRGQALTQSSLRRSQQQLEGLDLRRLVNPRRTRRSLAAAGLAALGVLILVILAPQAAATATTRWIAPFSNSSWPKRVRVVNATSVGSSDQPRVHPIEAPINLQARVEKGYRPRMRVSVRYRLVRQGQPERWKQKLLTEQDGEPTASGFGRSPGAEDTNAVNSVGPGNRQNPEGHQGAASRTQSGAQSGHPNNQSKHGRYERLIELPDSLEALLTGDEPGTAKIEFYFIAGDDHSDSHVIQLAARPAVTHVTARISPPEYATALAQRRTLSLGDQSSANPRANALRGSHVILTIETNKPLPVTRALANHPTSASPPPQLAKLAPGLADINGLSVSPVHTRSDGREKALEPRTIGLTFALESSAKTAFHLRDDQGLTNLAQQTYALNATTDKPPTVSLSSPATDRSVLSGAVVNLAALAQDDIGVEEIRIEAKPSEAKQAGGEVKPANDANAVQDTRAVTEADHVNEVRGDKVDGDKLVGDKLAGEKAEGEKVGGEKVGGVGGGTESASGQATSAANQPSKAEPSAKVPQTEQSARAEQSAPQILARRTGRQSSLSTQYRFDLKPLDLQPGQRVRITAAAKDVFALAGRRHDWVHSTPRTLRIISRGQLIGRLRGGLSDIRRQALDLEQRQARTQDRTKTQARSTTQLSAEQAELTRRIKSQQAALTHLKNKAKQNRLKSPDLDRLMSQASTLLQAARQSSHTAAQTLEANTSGKNKPTDQTDTPTQTSNKSEPQQTKETKQTKPTKNLKKTEQSPGRQTGKAPHEPSAKPPNPKTPGSQNTHPTKPSNDAAVKEQTKVRRKLTKLAQTLDQGGSALKLKAALSQLADEQSDINQKTRKLLPQTAGRNPDKLPEELKKQIDKLNRRQKELANQAKDFTKQARRTSKQLDRPENPDRERAAAKTLKQAADIAQRRGLSSQMKDAAQSINQNQLSQAGSDQTDARQTLSKMSQAMDGQAKQRQQMLRRRLAKLGQQLQKLIERQGEELKNLKNTAKADLATKVPALAPQQNALRQLTMNAVQTARSNESTQAVAKPIDQAVDAQADAVRALRQADVVHARTGEKAGRDHLKEALQLVRKRQEKQAQSQAREKRSDLAKQYKALAKRQTALRTQVVPLAKAAAPTRRMQAKMRSVGSDQTDLRTKVKALAKKAAATLVFKRMHQHIDELTTEAADSLRRSEANPRVLRNQRQAASLLGSMAEALKQPKNDSDFQRNPGQGQGGGGGKGGAKPKLIPNVAELKLLKAVQQSIYQQTRALDSLKAGQSETKGQSRPVRAEALGKRQHELQLLGQKLINKVKRSQQHQGGLR